jgi:hypothetical protein
MRELKRRLVALEKKGRLKCKALAMWCRVYQYEDQTEDEALAAWEAEHGPLADKNVVMRVIVRSPFQAQGRTTGAVCPMPG